MTTSKISNLTLMRAVARLEKSLPYDRLGLLPYSATGRFGSKGNQARLQQISDAQFLLLQKVRDEYHPERENSARLLLQAAEQLAASPKEHERWCVAYFVGLEGLLLFILEKWESDLRRRKYQGLYTELERIKIEKEGQSCFNYILDTICDSFLRSYTSEDFKKTVRNLRNAACHDGSFPTKAEGFEQFHHVWWMLITIMALHFGPTVSLSMPNQTRSMYRVVAFFTPTTSKKPKQNIVQRVFSKFISIFAWIALAVALWGTIISLVILYSDGPNYNAIRPDYLDLDEAIEMNEYLIREDTVALQNLRQRAIRRHFTPEFLRTKEGRSLLNK